MKYQPLSAQFYTRNREAFSAQMKDSSIAVFNSNDIFPISADSTMPFQQHRDILYLSGVDQEESILLLCPQASDPKMREVLFVRETSEEIAIWEGEKLTKEKATELSGVKNVQWLDQFDRIFKTLMSQVDLIYLNKNEHLRANTEVQTREDRFIDSVKKDFPAHQVARSAPFLHKLRSLKHEEEIKAMQQACDLTAKGFERILSFIKPGVWEYEIEAELWHEFIRGRSKGFAYTPIIASGANACVLHYIENNMQCKDGEVILMDFGAEYANYASDLTRCVPVSGRFTQRQKEVYNAVLRVKNAATDLLRPGITLGDYHKEVGLLMESELKGLGLIDDTDIKNQNPEWPAYKKYFMHGTSHYIGLDTHDVGSWSEPIEASMAFTVEPGIYIREEGLGIRLEDDIVVQPQGAPLNLMGHIPIEADQIEDIMNP